MPSARLRGRDVRARAPAPNDPRALAQRSGRLATARVTPPRKPWRRHDTTILQDPRPRRGEQRPSRAIVAPLSRAGHPARVDAERGRPGLYPVRLPRFARNDDGLRNANHHRAPRPPPSPRRGRAVSHDERADPTQDRLHGVAEHRACPEGPATRRRLTPTRAGFKRAEGVGSPHCPREPHVADPTPQSYAAEPNLRVAVRNNRLRRKHRARQSSKVKLCNKRARHNSMSRPPWIPKLSLLRAPPPLPREYVGPIRSLTSSGPRPLGCLEGTPLHEGNGQRGGESQRGGTTCLRVWSFRSHSPVRRVPGGAQAAREHERAAPERRNARAALFSNARAERRASGAMTGAARGDSKHRAQTNSYAICGCGGPSSCFQIRRISFQSACCALLRLPSHNITAPPPLVAPHSTHSVAHPLPNLAKHRANAGLRGGALSIKTGRPFLTAIAPRRHEPDGHVLGATP